MAELSCAVNPAFPTGGTSANNNKDFPPISCPGTIPQNFNGKDASVEERGRIMISKLTKYPPPSVGHWHQLTQHVLINMGLGPLEKTLGIQKILML